MNKLNWFPLSFAKQKRKIIYNILRDLHQKIDTQTIVSSYFEEKRRILSISYSNPDEYPPFDENGFQRYLKFKTTDNNCENVERDYHLNKLKFYYSPDLF